MALLTDAREVIETILFGLIVFLVAPVCFVAAMLRIGFRAKRGD